jgi:hypothetical protein
MLCLWMGLSTFQEFLGRKVCFYVLCFQKMSLWTRLKCTKKSANHGILGIAGKVLMRQTKLLHLIKVNL